MKCFYIISAILHFSFALFLGFLSEDKEGQSKSVLIVFAIYFLINAWFSMFSALKLKK